MAQRTGYHSCGGDEPWQTPERQLSAFETTLGDDSREALEGLVSAERREIVAFLRFQRQDDEEDQETAANRVNKAREGFLATLTENEIGEYESIGQARRDGAPTFDLGIVQRYVLWRVFDLGWTKERFGRFDLDVGYFRGREARKPERMAKKYQWIAYHEILAYLSDHYQWCERYVQDDDVRQYRGTWQLSCRDIDPSLTLPSLPKGITRSERICAWWDGPVFQKWREELTHREWLSQSDEFPDPKAIMRVGRDLDSTRWISVRAISGWQQSTPPDREDYEVDQREVWLHSMGYFIDAREATGFLDWSRSVDFWGRWMPEPPMTGEVFLGEHGWSPAFADLLAMTLNPVRPAAEGSPPCPTEVRVTAFEYNASGGQFDCSVDGDCMLYLPNPEFIEVMGLRWTGHGADFVDHMGKLAAFDPTAHEEGSAGLLLREDLLVEYLNREGLALVWAVLGRSGF